MKFSLRTLLLVMLACGVLAGRYGKQVIDAFSVEEPTAQSIVLWNSSNNREILGSSIGKWDEASAGGMSSYEMEDLMHVLRQVDETQDVKSPENP